MSRANVQRVATKDKKEHTTADLQMRNIAQGTMHLQRAVEAKAEARDSFENCTCSARSIISVGEISVLAAQDREALGVMLNSLTPDEMKVNQQGGARSHVPLYCSTIK